MTTLGSRRRGEEWGAVICSAFPDAGVRHFSLGRGFADSESGVSDPDYIVDLSSQGSKPPGSPRNDASLQGRPWLAMRWRCCSTYSRVYRNIAGTAYEGFCPRCGRSVQVKISPDGTNHRFFEAF